MKTSKWFVNPQPRKNAKLRVFCFPYAGGSAATYYSWPERFPEEIELVAVQLPGRTNRMFETPHDSMDTLVDDLLSLRPFLTEKPYVLLGHSMGALIAFELASELCAAGERVPEHLIASACRAPHLRKEGPKWQGLSKEGLMTKLGELAGTAGELIENKELMELVIPTFRADLKIAENYLTRHSTLNCPITVLRGIEDPSPSLASVEKWSDVSRSSVKIVSIPGNHFFIDNNKAQTIEEVLSIVQKVAIPL